MRLVIWSFPLMLALISGGAGHGATLLLTDFTRDRQGWKLNGDAALVRTAEAGYPQLLRLTGGRTGQVGVAWTELRRRVPSFSFLADVRVRFSPGIFGDCPADAFALVFAPVESDAIGNPGSSIGLCETWLIYQFIAVEVNTWSGQGLGTNEEKESCSFGKNETFAFDVVTPSGRPIPEAARFRGDGTPERGGFKIGQTLPPPGMKLVNGGWYRYQWNVAPDGTMTLFVTGLDPGNQRFQRVRVLEVKMAWNPLDRFDGRWGLSASTGAAVQTVEVARARIESPAIDPL